MNSTEEMARSVGWRANLAESSRPWVLGLRRFLRNKPAVVGAVMIVLMGLAAGLAPVLGLEDPTRQDYDAILASPGLDHPLGTDRLGRDTMSRLIHGARTSMAVAVLTPVVVLIIGVIVGVVAGMATARVDNLIMRGVDIVYAFPDLLLIILLRAVFGGSFFMMFLAIGLASWPTVARLVRGQTLSLREREFMLSARAAGAAGPHVVLRHVLPNAMGPVIVAVTFMVPRVIFAEVALSYIGIGISPPTPSWGSMMLEGYGVIFAAYEQILFPTAAIALLMLSFTFLGDGLRDLMDPRDGRVVWSRATVFSAAG